MAKLKTIRASEPNSGIRAQAKRKLKAMALSFVKRVRSEMIASLETGGAAMDASLSNPQDPAVATRMKGYADILKTKERILRKTDINRLDDFVQSKLVDWLTEADGEARAFSKWFARALVSSTTASQRAALKAAGISPHFMRRRWAVPVGRQFVSPEAAEQIPKIVEESTNLITRMFARDVERLQDTIVQGIEKGQDVDSIKRLLVNCSGFTERRAELVAIDQTNKVHNAISTANSQAIGITEGTWVHVPGQFTSRESHIKMNGKRFKLSEGLFDPAVGKNVTPGSLPYCRCVYRSILPPDILDAMKDD